MPNWCCTSYYVTTKGLPKSEQIRLYPTLLKFAIDVGIATSTDSGTDFGRGWLGQVYIQAGYKWIGDDKREWDKDWIDCRGSVDDHVIEYDGDKIEGVMLYCQTAWGPKFESFEQMINEKYPGLKTLCLADEPGCEIYFNSDVERIRFTEKYVVNTDEDSYYPETDEELLELVEELTGIKCASVGALWTMDRDTVREKYIEHMGYSEDEAEEAYINFHEYMNY